MANGKEKTVIVTGGSKGIGKGISRNFASRGMKVAIVGRNKENAEDCAAEIRKEGGVVKAFEADVSNAESVQAMAKKVNDEFGGIDILCSNAGIFPSVPLEEMTVEEWEQVMNINAKGTFLSIQGCLPYLKESQAGRIVITSSITGPFTGYPGWSHYSASKAAQLGFMRTAALELANYNITVNAILPGNVLTEGLKELGEDYLDTMAKTVPLKRLGTVEDIAHAAYFLASEEAGFITGQTIVVDGGQILPEDGNAIN